MKKSGASVTVTGAVAIGVTCLDDCTRIVFEAEFGYTMMKSLLKILLLALVIGAAPQALAGKFDLGDLLGQVEGVAIADGKDHRNLTTAQSGGPTLSEAKNMVKRQCNCRIVKSWTTVSGGREVHHIRFMTKDGTVKTREIQGRHRQP